ncbi:hypothetical protein [Arvimicrobium flavum]|uniref:hypothetical protein n=1 Tax=Arvimicrobium flavum TaxID=3393320 RepID=UPI00237B47A1|nr:hypothetical protein [Mesorhizobium shangrilense]
MRTDFGRGDWLCRFLKADIAGDALTVAVPGLRGVFGTLNPAELSFLQTMRAPGLLQGDGQSSASMIAITAMLL